MPQYLILMHTDRQSATETADDWTAYIDRLVRLGLMRGGSAIGDGRTFRKRGVPAVVTATLDGYLKIEAASLDGATAILAGNPTFEAGGTVEIRELPETD